METYYYESRDGLIISTVGLDPFLSNDDERIARVFRKDGNRLKCIHDNDRMPWGYHLSIEESMDVLLRSSEPIPGTGIDLND